MDPTDETKEFDLKENLANTTIELDGQKYTIYYESVVSESDKAFAYVAEKGPDQKEYLFKVSTFGADKNMSRNKLEELNFSDENTAKTFLNIGLQLVKNSNKNNLGSFQQAHHYRANDYSIAYQSRDLTILGESMYDAYLKRIERRTPVKVST